LKLKCDMLLSTFAFKFNLRRCNWAHEIALYVEADVLRPLEYQVGRHG